MYGIPLTLVVTLLKHPISVPPSSEHYITAPAVAVETAIETTVVRSVVDYGQVGVNDGHGVWLTVTNLVNLTLQGCDKGPNVAIDVRSLLCVVNLRTQKSVVGRQSVNLLLHLAFLYVTELLGHVGLQGIDCAYDARRVAVGLRAELVGLLDSANLCLIALLRGE